MKKIFFILLGVLCLQLFLVSCQEDEAMLDTASAPVEDDAVFTYSSTERSANVLKFSNTSNVLFKRWNFGNGKTGEGNEPVTEYPLKGSYKVTLTVYTAGGSATTTQTIEIAEDDPTLLDLPIYNIITGGKDEPQGKTWVIDSKTLGHMAVGNGSSLEIYWPAPPDIKSETGLYDDKYTFALQGFKYTQQTNGDVYIDNLQVPKFPGAYLNKDDYTAPFTAPDNLTWTLTESDGKQFITINGNGFIGFYTGVSTYEILTATSELLHLRYLDAGDPGLAWYLRLVPEGYTPPAEEPEEPEEPETPEYKIEDISEDFEGEPTVNFVNDSQGSIVAYDNPAPVPINISAKVGKYVKASGNAGEFANVQIPLDYKMDIRNRHIFKLKVFIPSYNDYTTEGGESWQSYKTLQKQVSVKLQNSDLGGNAYTTQAEVIQNNLQTDKWLELTFDFSAFSSRTDFDKVVIQIGGEAIFTGGIFFIDDFELLPE
ncbi:PKD domain-containing protein [Chryseosolibacter indicus]|uniref:PKD domain-containing protein n=1 Tax=Chryseosolibacter indicus TaxID=2782351 RepID=A0ABS5VYR7_9BACT|nr:PKD domain-containing protein [Chryseosolibacter indicus]MBT1705995.1 PKD domain-containing protein [Chryseosolibacter indicus]